MTARRLFLAGVVAALALPGCAKSAGPVDAGSDPGNPLDVVMGDQGPRDPGPGDTLPDPGSPEDPGGSDVDDPGAELVDDPGPSDPGADPGADTGPELTGKVDLAPYTMEFGYVQAGGSSKRPLQVRNLGPGALRIDKFRVTGSVDFAPDLGFAPTTVSGGREWAVNPPRILAADETWPVSIVFAPTVDADGQAEIEVQTSDTSRTSGPPKAFLRGNLQRACAEWVPDNVDFGSVVAGESVSQVVTIKSCGGLPLELHDLTLEDAWVAVGVSLDFAAFPGGVAPTAAAPVTIPVGGSLKLRLVWAPTTPPTGLGQPVSGNLILVGTQFPGATFLPLVGTLLAGRCAVPQIRPFDVTTVPTCAVLSASGSPSTSYFAPVDTFAWTVDQPTGHDGMLVPDGARQDVSLFAGLPGTYTFRLQVEDALGHPSCGEDTRSVTVTPRLVAGLALTWRSASGMPIQSGAGPDLDLHFLHPAAPVGNAGWFSTLYDCYYANPTPDKEGVWQMNGGVSLVSQSLDGMLPEAVVLDLTKCVGGRTFRFGVHYPAGGAYGNAIATLKIYASGSVLMDHEVTLAPGDLWDAGTFECGVVVNGITVPNTVVEVAGPSILHDFTP